MNVKLGFSPCPNDTYMMYGLMHDRVETYDLSFDANILDVEELNEKALDHGLDCTKLSFRTYYDVCDHYELLTAGAALGRGNGPLLIANHAMGGEELAHATIAVPGMQTTATFLLQFAFPSSTNLVPMLFSDIEDAITNEEVDAGVIIHETRFLYADHGFKLLADLGERWEQETGQPIPLGGFVVKADLADQTKQQLLNIIRSSIAYADNHYATVLPYMREHAQELDPEVIEKHVAMFVNDFSYDLQANGKAAVSTFFHVLNEINSSDKYPVFI